MNRKLGEEKEPFSIGFRAVMAGVLAYILSDIIATIFKLPFLAGGILVAVSCVGMLVIVFRYSELTLKVVCIILLVIGCLFAIVSVDENIDQIGWNLGLLGAGASLVAIAIALYSLLMQAKRKEDAVNTSDSVGGTDNLKKDYVWVEEIEKFRCEYCKHLGRYRYYKTLSGIKGHIAREHV